MLPSFVRGTYAPTYNNERTDSSSYVMYMKLFAQAKFTAAIANMCLGQEKQKKYIKGTKETFNN